MGLCDWHGLQGRLERVRNSNTTKAAHIKREGYMFNTKGVLCIAGYNRLGNASKDAHIEREGYMFNKKGVLCIAAYHKLGNEWG